MFRVTKADHNLTAPKNAVQIPRPTKADKEWARCYEYFDEYDINDICSEGNLWRLAFAIKRGYDIEYDVYEHMKEAITKDQTDIIRLLLAHNAELNGGAEYNYLALAAASKSPESFKTLLELGADLNAAFKYSYGDNHTAISKMLTMMGGHWVKTGPAQINRIETQDMCTFERQVTTSFNFAAQKIITTISEQDNLCGPVIERFSEQDSFDEILQAYEELIKQGGTPSPIEKTIGRAIKTPRTAVKLP